MKKNILYSVLFTLLVIMISGCRFKKDEVIVLDNSHPLALAPDVSWAVVSDPYAAYRDEIGWNSSGKGHCRKGEILQVQSKSLDKNNEVWYNFEQGWLPSNCVSVFNNRLKAENYSKKLEK